MKKPPAAAKKRLDLSLGGIRVEFASDGATSLFMPVVVYAVVRIVAKLVTALFWMSAGTAFLTTMVWLAAAIYLFAVVTWQRDDNWLAAGILVAATFLGAGLVADLLRLVIAPGSFNDVALGMASSLVQMLIRGLLLVPLVGSLVAGARWVTGELVAAR